MRTRFAGYATDCTITGEIELEADRFKDLLDEHTELVILDAILQSLDDGHEVSLPRMELDRHDILAVGADPPRGPHGRRIHTVRHRVLAQVGPYRVAGELHEKPGVAPMTAFHTKRPMVSFTDASITFMRSGQTLVHHAATLLVNRDHVQWTGPDSAEARAAWPDGRTPAPTVERPAEIAAVGDRH